MDLTRERRLTITINGVTLEIILYNHRVINVPPVTMRVPWQNLILPSGLRKIIARNLKKHEV